MIKNHLLSIKGINLSFIISFEYNDRDSIEFHLDKDVAKKLLQELMRIAREGKGNDDTYLISNEWGGDFLSSKPNGDSNKPIHAVKVMYWE